MRRGLMVAVCVSLALSGGAVFAAAKRAPKRPAKKAPPRAVKGTVQMAGDNAKMGITYTIGKGNGAVNFTLRRAEYSITRLSYLRQTLCPQAGEKYLVLHYTIHNPNKVETGYYWGTLRFTAVDSENMNREGLGTVAKEGTGEEYNIRLKPAQKIEAWTAIKLPAKATVPKLIVQRGSEQPVLRLYFKPKDIKGLPAPFADSADASGATALEEVPAEVGTYYPLGRLDAKLVSVAYSEQPVGNERPRKGYQLCVATVSVRNPTLQKQSLFWGTIRTQARLNDGDKTDEKGWTMLKAQRDENARADLEPNEEATARILIPVPTGTTVSKLSLTEGGQGRRYQFTVPAAQ